MFKIKRRSDFLETITALGKPDYKLLVWVKWRGATEWTRVDLMGLEHEHYFMVQKVKEPKDVAIGRTPPLQWNPNYDPYFRAEWWSSVGIPCLGRYFVECRRRTSIFQN